MYVTLVHVHVKPEHLDSFIDSIRANHEASVREPGNIRFEKHLRARGESFVEFRRQREIALAQEVDRASEVKRAAVTRDLPHGGGGRQRPLPRMAGGRHARRLTPAATRDA